MFFSIRTLILSRKYAKSRVFNKLSNAPHRKGIVRSMVFKTPKKPNSALRTIARVGIYKNGRLALSRVMGSGRVPQRYNRVLLRGGRANDVPGIRTTLVRNVYDFSGLDKQKRRSIYGTPRPPGFSKHIRRKFRSFAINKYV